MEAVFSTKLRHAQAVYELSCDHIARSAGTLTAEMADTLLMDPGVEQCEVQLIMGAHVIDQTGPDCAAKRQRRAVAEHPLQVAAARLAQERLQCLDGVLGEHGVVKVQQAEGEEAEGVRGELWLRVDQPREHLGHVQQPRQRKRVAVTTAHDVEEVLAYGR